MSDYLFKVEIELDDDKIISDDKYELDDIYDTIRNCFAKKHIPEIKSNSHTLAFSTNEHDRYGYAWAGINSVYLSYIKPYITKIMWYNREHGDDYFEDVLTTFKEGNF